MDKNNHNSVNSKVEQTRLDWWFCCIEVHIFLQYIYLWCLCTHHSKDRKSEWKFRIHFSTLRGRGISEEYLGLLSLLLHDSSVSSKPFIWLVKNLITLHCILILFSSSLINFGAWIRSHAPTWVGQSHSFQSQLNLIRYLDASESLDWICISGLSEAFI